MSATSLLLPDAQATQSLAQHLARKASQGDCITLSGDLGAGKTTFAQGFIGALLKQAEDITSPTFNIVHHYETALGVRLWHVDLYRVKHENELEALGLEEAFESGISLIEWPEIAQAYVPTDALHIRFTIEQNDARRVELMSKNTKWQEQ